MNKITPEMRKHYGALADDLMCAFLANQAGVTFVTIKKRYGRKATRKPPGDYWIFLAARTTGEMLELRDQEAKRASRG